MKLFENGKDLLDKVGEFDLGSSLVMLLDNFDLIFI
jgi:hypothetical protein